MSNAFVPWVRALSSRETFQGQCNSHETEIMKLLWKACLLAAPLLALPAEVNASGGNGFQICLGVGWNRWNPCAGSGGGCGPAQAGPWYTYWPYEAHFQTPAMPQFPYWPGPMTSPIAGGHGCAPMIAPPTPSPIQGVGYYSQWPSYWYGH